MPCDADREGPARKGLLAAKGLPKIGEPMLDYKTHVSEAIEALAQYLHCMAASRMVGWGEECLRDLQDQTRKALGRESRHGCLMTDDTRPAAPQPATYPGEPGSLADIGRRRFIADEIAYRERLHPEPNADELAYRARLRAELDRA